ncbi:MAG TPA: histidine kinase [Thermoanaerobaculia bacterium]|nr:histidine kinase [Thermoanaerobaculia bacterium]
MPSSPDGSTSATPPQILALPEGSRKDAEKDPAKSPAAPRLGLLLALWTAVGLLYWVQTYHSVSARAEGYGWREAFGDTWPTWAIWLALAPLIALADRRALMRRPLVQRLVGHALLSVPVTGIYVAASLGLDRVRFERSTASWGQELADRFQWHLTNYWVLAGLLILLSLDRTVARQRAEVAELGRRLAEARLRSLTQQVRPHFLFNSLNTVAAVLEREPARARRLLAELGENLRFTLERTGEAGVDLIPCSEELALVERTLALEQARLGERLVLERDVDGDPAVVAVPPFSIQVLVENAIRHAVEPRVEPTRVALSVVAGRERVRIEVSDDGPGLAESDEDKDEDKDEGKDEDEDDGEDEAEGEGGGDSAGCGIGLENLRRRLDALFGDQASLSVGPGAGGAGVRAVLDLPAVATEGRFDGRRSPPAAGGVEPGASTSRTVEGARGS